MQPVRWLISKKTNFRYLTSVKSVFWCKLTFSSYRGNVRTSKTFPTRGQLFFYTWWKPSYDALKLIPSLRSVLWTPSRLTWTQIISSRSRGAGRQETTLPFCPLHWKAGLLGTGRSGYTMLSTLRRILHPIVCFMPGRCSSQMNPCTFLPLRPYAHLYLPSLLLAATSQNIFPSSTLLLALFAGNQRTHTALLSLHHAHNCIMSHWYWSPCPTRSVLLHYQINKLLPHQAIGLGAPQTIIRCHRGHYKSLSRCRLVGSCVRPGENFFP